MKILTICEGGNVRSVGLARILKTNLRRHNAIAIGAGWALSIENNREPGTYLCHWAELIVIMSEHFRSGVPIPKGCESKVKICEVGPDVYGNPSHPELIKLCEAWVTKEGL
jgi:hypothetical protein